MSFRFTNLDECECECWFGYQMGILIPIPRGVARELYENECMYVSHLLGPVVKWALVSTVLTTDMRISIIELITSYYELLVLGKINVQTKRLCDCPYKSAQWQDGYCRGDSGMEKYHGLVYLGLRDSISRSSINYSNIQFMYLSLNDKSGGYITSAS